MTHYLVISKWLGYVEMGLFKTKEEAQACKEGAVNRARMKGSGIFVNIYRVCEGQMLPRRIETQLLMNKWRGPEPMDCS